MRPVTICGIGALMLTALIIYEVKYEVRQLAQEVTALEAELAQEYQALHVLQAEWAYTTRPERLRKLTKRHLELAPVNATQIHHPESLYLLEEVVPKQGLAAAEAGRE